MVNIDVEYIDELAKSIYDMALYNAKKCEIDAESIPEFMAYEITSLAEWKARSPLLARQAVEKIADTETLPKGCVALIKKYFELPY